MDLAAALSGRWAVRRLLYSDVDGEFTGVATFEACDAGLAWDERGRLRLGSHEGPAGRRLLVVRDGDGWAVEFADGRPFHPLDLTGAWVEHRCGDDVYRGSYRLLGPGALEVRWIVSGPGKEQRIDSSYRRLTSRCRRTGGPRSARRSRS
jgi:hypothetical protein